MAPSKPALAVAEDVETVATPAEKESTVRQRLMGQAMISLRESHREEFDQIARELFRKEGLEYRRRLSDTELAFALGNVLSDAPVATRR